MWRKILYLIVILFGIEGCATTPATTRESPMRAQRSEALLQALLALGVDYANGGGSPERGFDCSGLVAHVYREAYGIPLPRNTSAQSETGIAVSLSELEPGDLVFYDTLGRPYSHVGIYVGDGRFVHAPKTGASVRVEHLDNAYWMRRFSGARRIDPRL